MAIALVPYDSILNPLVLSITSENYRLLQSFSRRIHGIATAN